MASSIGCPLFEHSWKINTYHDVKKVIGKIFVDRIVRTSLITLTTLQVVAEDSSRTSIFVLLRMYLILIWKLFLYHFVTTVKSSNTSKGWMNAAIICCELAYFEEGQEWGLWKPNQPLSQGSNIRKNVHFEEVVVFFSKR